MHEVEQRLKKADVQLPEKSWQLGQTRVFMKDEVIVAGCLVSSKTPPVASLLPSRRWKKICKMGHFAF
eukprot:417699-Amphidinium_carterae.1